STIAAALVDAINGAAHDGTSAIADPTAATLLTAGQLAAQVAANQQALVASASGATVTIRQRTTSGLTDPFVDTVSRRGSSDRGVFRELGATDVTGSIQVPVVLPGFQFLADLFPFLAQNFTTIDTLGFIATPSLELFGPDGLVLATSTCTV